MNHYRYVAVGGKVVPVQDKNVSVLTYSPNRITVTFDGEVLSNRVKIVPHEAWVGSYSKNSSEVYVDDDVPQRFRRSMAIHETVEKYLKERYGLSDLYEGHEYADEIERRWHLKNLGSMSWENYSAVVERVHRKEVEHALENGKPIRERVGAKLRALGPIE